MSQLDDALKNYRENKAIIENKFKSNKPVSSENILALLTSRDLIQALLVQKEITSNSKEANLFKGLQDIIQLDEELEVLFEKIFLNTDFDLKQARKSFNPNSDSWWWFIQPKAQKKWWDKYDRLWNFIAVTCLIVALVFVFEIYSKFSQGNPDEWAYLIIALHTALLTCIFGAVFTNEGQTIANQILNRIIQFCGSNIHLKQEVRMFLSILFLTLILAFKLSLPSISTKYMDSGINLYSPEETSLSKIIVAQNKLERAIALDSNNRKAYYYLGLINEDLDDVDNASKQYLISKKIGSVESTNNLARLYILKEEYGKAATKLNEVKLDEIENQDIFDENLNATDLQYRIQKNLAWARFKQERYNEALSLLNLAEKYNPGQDSNNQEKAGFYCLKPQIIEQQIIEQQKLDKLNKSQSQALCPMWWDCVAYAQGTVIEEDEWIGIANKNLKNCL